MAEDVIPLFDEYATRFARGERPDLRAYLERAGEGREELARLVDAWLRLAPPPPADEETVALAEAWARGEAPLVFLRARRGLRRGQVVEALMARFRLDPAKRGKVERYYHEVEAGLRVPADQRLLTALAELLGARVGDLLSWRPLPLEAEPAYLRSAEAAPVPLPAPPQVAEEGDEIDELFRPAQRR